MCINQKLVFPLPRAQNISHNLAIPPTRPTHDLRLTGNVNFSPTYCTSAWFQDKMFCTGPNSELYLTKLDRTILVRLTHTILGLDRTTLYVKYTGYSTSHPLNGITKDLLHEKHQQHENDFNKFIDQMNPKLTRSTCSDLRKLLLPT